MPRPVRYAAFFAALLAGAALILASSCLTATQVTLEIVTDEPCGNQSTAIYAGDVGAIGSTTPDTTTSACTPGSPISRIGTIVLTPSGDKDGLFAVKVETVLDGGPSPDFAAACDGPQGITSSCIRETRQMHFQEHTSLVLRIEMYSACAGTFCPDPDTTCVNGACVDNTVDPSFCQGGTCDLPGDAAAVDAPEPSDGPYAPDALDAPTVEDGAPPPADGGIGDGSLDSGDSGDDGACAQANPCCCIPGGLCCISSSGAGPATCVPSNSVCAGVDITASCLDHTDCDGGFCCAVGNLFRCQPTCSGSPELCNPTKQDCSGLGSTRCQATVCGGVDIGVCDGGGFGCP